VQIIILQPGINDGLGYRLASGATSRPGMPLAGNGEMRVLRDRKSAMKAGLAHEVLL
jgi:hypothetical protein